MDAKGRHGFFIPPWGKHLFFAEAAGQHGLDSGFHKGDCHD
jgi:hypothetical protein